MKLLLLAAIAAVTLAGAPASVAGRWTMTVAGSPHGDVAMGLALAQDGVKVTGTFSSPHGDMDVAGEFAKGELKIATTAGNEDDRIYLQARLNEDGALAGTISSPMGDMKWTATRAKETAGK